MAQSREMSLSNEEVRLIQDTLLATPNASVRIVKSPYGDNPIVIQSDATGEVSAPTLAEAMLLFVDMVRKLASRVAVTEEHPVISDTPSAEE